MAAPSNKTEKLAQESPYCSFPDIINNITKMTDEISLVKILENTVYFNRVYFLTESKSCYISLVGNVLFVHCKIKIDQLLPKRP